MKRNILLLCVLALGSLGCTGSQEIVEPNRDNFDFHAEPVIATYPGDPDMDK